MSKQLNILVVGSGGREHTILRSCLKSPLVKRVIAAPGNGGMENDAQCFPVNADDCHGLLKLAKEQLIDFVIIGPEVPLALGLADILEDNGILAYGPRLAGARFESSKSFTKDFLKKYRIPTAAYETFTDANKAIDYLREQSMPIVIKASGLAAGKGVIIAQNLHEAEAAVRNMMENRCFGESGSEVVIEEFMEGEEASIMLMVCRDRFVMLPASQDHKRVGDGDTGLNTGGMGAYAPAAVVTPQIKEEVISKIINPTLAGIIAEGIDYRGTLYVGIMITQSGTKVVEFNVRFGDPETQVLLPLLETDPVSVMHEIARGELNPKEVIVRDAYATVIVVAAKGYPESFKRGEIIRLPKVTDATVDIIHAGTKKNSNGDLLSNGGRVLGVTAYGKTLREAVDKAYSLAKQIDYPSAYYRTDIAFRELNRQQKKAP